MVEKIKKAGYRFLISLLFSQNFPSFPIQTDAKTDPLLGM